MRLSSATILLSTLAALGALTACSCSSEPASDATSNYYFRLEGFRLANGQTLNLERVNDVSKLAIDGCHFEVHQPVTLEYDFADGIRSVTTIDGKAVERPASPTSIWIQGHPLEITEGKLIVGDKDYGVVETDQSAVFKADGVYIDGSLRGPLPKLLTKG